MEQLNLIKPNPGNDDIMSKPTLVYKSTAPPYTIAESQAPNSEKTSKDKSTSCNPSTQKPKRSNGVSDVQLSKTSEVDSTISVVGFKPGTRNAR